MLSTYLTGPSQCAGNTGLRTLNLGSNNIGDQGAIVLAEALKVIPPPPRPPDLPTRKLAIQNLASNYIGDQEAIVLAEALEV